MSIQRLLELNRERGQTNDHANTYLAVHPSVWQGLIADSIRESGTREDLSDHIARLVSIPVGIDYTLPVGAWELRDQVDKRVIERGSAAPSDAAVLSKLLWDAREVIAVLAGVTKRRYRSDRPLQLVAEIDNYRAGRGWSPNGHGGEG